MVKGWPPILRNSESNLLRTAGLRLDAEENAFDLTGVRVGKLMTG